METMVYDQILSQEDRHWWYKGMFAACNDCLERYVFSKWTGGHNSKIFDVGCGTGFWTKLLERYGSVIAMDNADESIAICKGRGLFNIIKSSADNIPLRNESCDLITGIGVIEHIEDDFMFAKEVARVLKCGGHAMFLTSAYMFLWSDHDDAAHHKRRYTMTELCAVIEKAGLKVVKASYINTFLFGPIIAARLLRRMKRTGKTIEHGSSDLFMPPSFINNIFYALLRIESWVIKWVPMPFGVNLLALAKKDRQ